MRRALSIYKSSYGAGHPEVAGILNNLARLLQSMNRFVEAEPLMRRVIEIICKFTRSTGHLHPKLRLVVANYRGLLTAMGVDRAEAMRRLTEAGFDPAWLKTPDNSDS